MAKRFIAEGRHSELAKITKKKFDEENYTPGPQMYSLPAL